MLRHSKDVSKASSLEEKTINIDCTAFGEYQIFSYVLLSPSCTIFRGMTVTSGSVSLKKDTQNLIGISIGGGAPLCPCLYVVQVFDNTPAARDGSLAAGDEIVGVNGQSVKGRTKVEVARMIQSVKVYFIQRDVTLQVFVSFSYLLTFSKIHFHVSI